MSYAGKTHWQWQGNLLTAAARVEWASHRLNIKRKYRGVNGCSDAMVLEVSVSGWLDYDL